MFSRRPAFRAWYTESGGAFPPASSRLVHAWCTGGAHGRTAGDAAGQRSQRPTPSYVPAGTWISASGGLSPGDGTDRDVQRAESPPLSA
jgi:hypothetical protein